MKITYKDKIIEVKRNTKIEDALKEEIKKSEYTVVGAIFNNEYKSLDFKINESGTIELIDISQKQGTKIYRRTLIYIMGMAFKRVCPEALITVNYQLSNEMFCEIDNMPVTKELIEKVKIEMKKIVEQDLPIVKKEMTRTEAKKFFEETGTIIGKLQLDLKSNKKIYMYFCQEYFNYKYGVIANSTGKIKIFDIIQYDKGFLVRYPSTTSIGKIPRHVKTKKLLWALEEYEDISRVLNVNTVYKLNKAILEGRTKDIVMTSEALHEKKIAKIADKITKNKNIKVILVAGPSSSGKTTFAKRLGIELKLNGIKPVTISVDNYFVERKNTPLDEDGEMDYDCIEAIDIKLFNKHLDALLSGKEVDMPEFDFIDGTKIYKGNKLKLQDNEVLIIEGIHCLNETLTSSIPQEQKYKIYISALTVLNMDYFNRLSTTDTRLIRRITRDYKYRGYSAKDTIKSWYKVNRGEQKYIFPYQEEADVIFNTSLIYELSALKPFVMPLLKEIKKDEPEYAEAQKLMDILKYFEPIPEEYVPKNSLLKEFLGGSYFED